VPTEAPAQPQVFVAGVPYPLTVSTDQAASWLGCSPETLQQSRGSGRLPVEPLVLGNRLRWPTMLVAQACGLPVEIVHPGEAAA
jgi:hypothetical protein